MLVASLPTLRERRSDIESMFETLAQLWMHGVAVNWRTVHDQERRARVPLPTYPFERESYWIDPIPPETARARVDVAPPRYAPVPIVPPIESRTSADVGPQLVTLFSELSGLREAQLVPSMNFFELGLDSLFLTQAASSIQKTFGVKITFRELLEELTTIETLAERVAERLPRVPAGERSADSPRRGVMTSGDVGPIIRQLDALRAQLESFMDAGGGATAPAREPVNARPPAAVEPPRESALPSPGAAAPANRGFGPIRPEKGSAGVSADQKRSLDKFVETYTSRTRESKRLTGVHRERLADPRSVAGFRSIWKEIVYQIVAARSAGSRLWDVDGNEYIDLVNGFGTNLFGHSPAFVTEAVEAQLELGIEIGPQSPLAGRRGGDGREMTGHERVAFCNTGSEAVMAAMRIARTVTGRDKIVMFAGSYHGTFDEVLVARRDVTRRSSLGADRAGHCRERVSRTCSCSTTARPAALESSARTADELAAVLVEPVQSRRPDLQPRRVPAASCAQITATVGTALIFDEVVTGFRVHPGGAQALFGIQADLATYGKVVGGGLPIGVVAGKRDLHGRARRRRIGSTATISMPTSA